MKGKIILVLLGMLCLTACHKTPTTTVINNQKETDSDIIISEQTTLEPEENMIYVTLTEETIKETIVAGDTTVTIDGVIIKPDRLDGLYQYIATETDYSEYEKNMMFLFGDFEEKAHKDEITKVILVEKDARYHAQIVNSRIYDINKMISRRGDITFLGFQIPVSENERKVDMSFDEAILNANIVLNRIGVNRQSLYICEYHEDFFFSKDLYDDTLPFGDTINVSYVQQLQGVNVSASNVDKYVNPISYVSFNSRGINSVRIVEYQYEHIRKIEQCVTYEQALEGFRKYLTENEAYNSVLFSEVSFEYALWKESVNGSRVLVAKPCWAFKVHEDVFGYDDIYIDAETGEVVERQK